MSEEEEVDWPWASLRALGIYAPLVPGHWMIGQSCSRCFRTFTVGSLSALAPIETPEQSGSLTVRTVPICATCHLHRKPVLTPDGVRVVENVENDGSVWTRDGVRYASHLVGPVLGE